jgi:hypothetical protein
MRKLAHQLRQDTWQVTAAILAATLLTGMLAACSGSPPARPPAAQKVTVTKDITVTVPLADRHAALPAVKAEKEPAATAILTRRVHVSGRSLPSAIDVLAPAQHLIASGPLPAGGLILSFRVRRSSVPAGTSPFLASLDTATGKWIPAPSTYDAATGVVSAHVTHFSIWAPLDWIKSAVAAVLKGALESLFSLGGLGTSPDCSGSGITVTDSRPGSGIGACAQPDGTVMALAKIVNQRPYPVDLLYEPGAQVDVPSTDIFSQLGEDLNNLSSRWHDRVLLPAGAEADGTVAVPAGKHAEFGTEMDTEAYLTSILGTGIRMLAKMGGGLEIKIAQDELDEIDKATCLRDAAETAQSATMSLSTAESLGSVAFECIATVAKGISDVVFTVATLAASLITELVGGIWGILDTITGNADHLITLQAAAPVTVYLAAGQDIYGQALFRPATAQVSGDGTYVLSGMNWSAWSATTAVGTGTALLDDCNPNCADGHIYHVPVEVTFSDPVKACKGGFNGQTPEVRYFWSRAEFVYPSGLPGPVSSAYTDWPFGGVVDQAKQTCSG